jgi:threonyl-tRNA synthetase
MNSQGNSKDKANLEQLRHSCAHLLAAAILRLYPHAKMTIGPAIENGFYYDFDFEGGDKPTEEDFPRIEKEMRKLVTEWKAFKRIEVIAKQAKDHFRNNPYKIEIIEELEKKGEPITFYQSGDFIDLCRGGHIDEPDKKLIHFKLLSTAGAYWRGDEKNKMLTRIYGTCFFTKEELDQYLFQLEEAKKRDHRVLGKKLDLYLLTADVGSGLLLLTQKGATVRRLIENLVISEQTKRGYLHVYTPHIGKKSLWERSGHWALYRDKIYAPIKIDDEEYLIKPMNCPFHMMIYQSQPRSYRDLPLRIAEIATVYRYEQAGELSGMLRVRHITQDDAHIFCRQDQVIDEFLGVFDLIVYLLKVFGLKDYYLRLGLRSDKEKYLGDDQIWQKAEEQIIAAIEKKGLNYKKSYGDAAFYGPKLDIVFKDAIGREWQCGTIQVDFMLPERFNLEYVDKDGTVKLPVVIHRAPLGSLERWMAMLIEQYAGAFPFWLSPIQVEILPISQKYLSYAVKVKEIFDQANIRNHLNEDQKTLSYKIRQSVLQKIPYQVIIGEREYNHYLQNKIIKVSVRTREGEDLGQIELYKFIEDLRKKLETFS